MSTTEEQTLRMRPHDEAVFVARDGRRARRLVRAAVVVTVLAVLWIVGLGIGMLGFGSLPGVSLLERSSPPSPVAPVERVPAAARDTARKLLAAKAASASVDSARAATLKASARARAQRRAAAKKAQRAAAGVPAPPPPAAAVNPAQRTRGWARTGAEAPPGQVRKAAPPPPPPATSKGRRVGQAPPTTPPPPARGQVKKALDPPPPPPKKG